MCVRMWLFAERGGDLIGCGPRIGYFDYMQATLVKRIWDVDEGAIHL